MRSAVLASVVCLASSTAAQALPILQLDIVGGHYDKTTQTVIAGSSNPFTLVAIFTPPPTATPGELAAAFAEPIYISAAISPGLSPEARDLGSFRFNNQTIDVTDDMVWGVPPVEQNGTADYDAGDLAPHAIFPTYFTEFMFNFDAAHRTTSYNTAEHTGSLTPNPNGDAYYATFAVDTRLLDPRYVVHFDLYNEKYKRCAAAPTQCVDYDVDRFSPFSKDAESAPVPEPATLLLLGSGVAAGAVRKYRQKKLAATVA